MNGLINRSFELFVRESYGERVWERLARQARVDSRGFLLLQNSPDSVTLLLLAEASKILRKPADELVEDLGGWLTRREPIRRLLRFSGRDFPEFIEAVSEFPDRALMLISNLEIPRIKVTTHSRSLYQVEIDSDTGILTMMLAGVLRGMADDYGALAVIQIEGTALRVDIALSEYSATRPFALVPEREQDARS